MSKRAWVVLVLLACLAGCGTMEHGRKSRREAKAISKGTDGTIDQGVIRAGFQSETGPDQRASIHFDLARAHESQGRDEAAIVEYQQVIDSATRHPSKVSRDRQAMAHRRMAAALDRLGQFPQSDVHYREALKLSPDDPRVWNDAGYSYYLQRRWPESVRALKTAAKLAPGDPRVQTNLGLALAGSGKLDAALAELTHAGGTAAAHANIGYVLATQGKLDAAREHYLIAQQLDPKMEPVHQALAKLGNVSATPATVVTIPPPADPSVARAVKPSTMTPLPELPPSSR